jgi:hypothetical protein
MKTIKPEDIKTFDIMLSASQSWLSRSIRKVINDKASHAAVFFKLDDVLYVYESEKHGLTNTNFNHYLDDKFTLWIARPIVSITEQQKKALLHMAISNAGHKTYDYWNLLIHQPIKFISKKLFGKAFWWGKRKPNADKHFICSELVAFVMNKFFGIEPNWHKISTEHFFHSDNYEVFKLEK